MIKNIIFDLGDVFLNLDKTAPFELLSERGIERLTFEDEQILVEYEVGKISTEAVVSHFKEVYEILPEDFKIIWNSMLLDFPKYRLNFLKNLKEKHPHHLILLSNTNDMHIEWVKSNWGVLLYNEFKSCFDQFYLSHEIHLRKPDASIFHFVLNENNLLAQETVFIDDTPANTEAAKELGIHTWNINPKTEDVIHLFSKLDL